MSLGLLLFASNPPAPERPKFQFKTAASVTSYTLPTGFSATGLQVDWGDETLDTNTTHTYATAGQYTITCYYATLSSIGTVTNTWGISEIMQLDANNITSVSFTQDKTISKIGTSGKVDFSGVSNCDQMFYQCTSLTSIANLDFSGATSCWRFFQGANTLTSADVTISNKCKSFDNFFTNANALTEISSNIDFSGGTSFDACFQGCTALTTIHTLATGGCSNFNNFFQGCSNLVSIASIDMTGASGASGVEEMFEGCNALTSIPTGFDIGSCTSLWLVFEGTAVTEIPMFDSSALTSADESFENCTQLTTIPALNFSKVTTMYNTFNNCPALTSIGITGIGVNITLSGTALGHDGLVTLFNNLATVTSTTTIILSSAQMAALSSSEQAIATGKGWTLTT